MTTLAKAERTLQSYLLFYSTSPHARTVITMVTYDRKTFIVQVTGQFFRQLSRLEFFIAAKLGSILKNFLAQIYNRRKLDRFMT